LDGSDLFERKQPRKNVKYGDRRVKRREEGRKKRRERVTREVGKRKASTGQYEAHDDENKAFIGMERRRETHWRREKLTFFNQRIDFSIE